ncbi:MAG: NADH-quinone oxidoreductase subunit NuoE [Chloroflexi bacterium]|nr:NADH-quinone oxidoreductase subunit NuoE [Chloroflexota bacterium]
MSDIPWEQVDAVIARWAPRGRAGLLPCLEEVQSITGWLSPEVSRRIAEGLKVPLADVFGVITFYGLLYDRPVGRFVVRVCDDVSCFINGSREIVDACRSYLGVEPGETTPDGLFTLETHPCLGRCERAPFMMVNELEFGPITPQDVPRILEEVRKSGAGQEEEGV